MLKTIITMTALALSVTAHAEAITLVANSTPPANCRAGEPYDIYASHEIHVINASYSNETMPYSYQLCMEGICDTVGNTITVYPQQTWDNSRLSHIRVRMAKGKHYYSVITEYGKTRQINEYEVRVR